jgi:D-3-phosphoglycerate dehydrogenase / 2-oxoglutarate reductase
MAPVSRGPSAALAPALVFDFDSTLVEVESLDALFDAVLRELAEDPVLEAPRSAALRARFRTLTDAGMEGRRDQAQTLARRLALFPPGTPTRVAVEETGREVAGRLSPSIQRHPDFLSRWPFGILIVSGGFRELIEPTARRLGLGPHRVLAHAFREGPGGRLELDPSTPVARGGKVGALKEARAAGLLPPEAPLWVVGDGATDLELRTAGVADVFVAFTENVSRPPVVAAADHVAASLDELLELLP